tara:strand:+ start:3499 stop:3969 length:471 start_codon:yes stop_codon:yes gene_type:complete
MPYRRVKHKKSTIKKWSKRHMVALANQSALIVIQRTQTEGLGLDDKKLPKYKGKGRKLGAYSYSHGKLRRDGGKYNGARIGGGLPTNRITLSVTGQMFRQFRYIRASGRRFSARVGPTGNSKKYAKHTSALRPWIGFSKKDGQKVVNAFRAIWRSL